MTTIKKDPKRHETNELSEYPPSGISGVYAKHQQVVSNEMGKPQAVMTNQQGATSCRHKFENSFEMPFELLSQPDPASGRQVVVSGQRHSFLHPVGTEHRSEHAWHGLAGHHVHTRKQID